MMKKQLLLIATTVASLTAHSQGLRVLPFGGIGTGTAQVDNLLSKDVHLQSYYEAGIDMQLRFRAHLLITAGIEWIHTVHKIGPFLLEDNFDPITGTIIGVPYERTYKTDLLRLPLKIGYVQNFSKKICVSLSAGPSLNYLLNVNSASTRNTVYTSDLSDYHKLNVGFVADASVSYQFTRRFGMMASPTYAYIANKKKDDGQDRYSIFGVRLAALISLAK